jgi:hypothetical protein
MNHVLGRNFNTLMAEDQGDARRWTCARNALGNVRFGGRGELNYSSYDKFQHFIAGADIGYRFLANVAGTAVELQDAFIRFAKEIFAKPEPHQVGWDYHDYEWTWAGGAFASKVRDLDQQGISNILHKFADGRIILSELYTSISKNKDWNPDYANNPNINHAESNFPNPIAHPFIATMIDNNIKKMEQFIESQAKN